MISYSAEQLSADLPAPADAEELRYTDPTLELNFETAANKETVVDFYRKTLGAKQWEPTLDHLVQIDDNDTMIFRDPGERHADAHVLFKPPGKAAGRPAFFRAPLRSSSLTGE